MESSDTMTSVQATSLSDKLSMETTEKVVKFIRKSGKYNAPRTVYVPKHVVEKSLDYTNVFTRTLHEGKTDILTMVGRWRLSLTCFKGKHYMNYCLTNEEDKSLW